MNNFWKNKKVFITGYKGFIGSHLFKTLKQNKAIVYGSNCPHYLKDYVYYFKKYKISHVFHLGAQSEVTKANKHPYETFHKNINGTFNILEACRLSNVKRIVVASTDKVYGEGLNKKETDTLTALYPYDVSKVCTDFLARSYIKTFDLNIGITRCCNVFGPGDVNFSRIIPYTIIQALQNKDIEIRSDGKNKREYMYVNDAVNAYLVLGENEQKDVFNFGTGTVYPVLKVVNNIMFLLPESKSKIKVLNIVKSEIKEQSLDSTKAKSVLGWKPVYSFTDGIIKTIKWYKNDQN